MTLLSTHLKPEEAAYIIDDSAAKVLFLSAELGNTPHALAAEREQLVPSVSHVYVAGDLPIAGAEPLDVALNAMPTTRVSNEISGFHMIYSSGTTGRPKGIVLPFTPGPIDEFNLLEGRLPIYGGIDPLVYLNVGPLYHGAPLSGMIGAQRLDGTFVTQRKFDVEGVLRAIQEHGVRLAQFVPTMFVRMLALPGAVRLSDDVSSLQLVIHAAARCPVEIKRRMMEWLGPVIFEYYGSTEGLGGTAITSEEWLRKPGSVGKLSLGPIRICDEDGNELPTGEAGTIWFEVPGDRGVEYLNDAEKTRKAAHPRHSNWFAVGEAPLGDGDGYLFLTERKDFMIISGGVNIYPQAIEDCLIVHPKVLDAAVIGVETPNTARKQRPSCCRVTGPMRACSESRTAHLGEHPDLEGNSPRSYEFVEELASIPSGKLAKQELGKLYGNPVADV